MTKQILAFLFCFTIELNLYSPVTYSLTSARELKPFTPPLCPCDAVGGAFYYLVLRMQNPCWRQAIYILVRRHNRICIISTSHHIRKRKCFFVMACLLSKTCAASYSCSLGEIGCDSLRCGFMNM